MGSIDDLTDEELTWLLIEYDRFMYSYRKEHVSTFEAFCSYLNRIGLGFIADSLKIATWGWERIQGIWRRIFGSSNRSW